MRPYLIAAVAAAALAPAAPSHAGLLGDCRATAEQPTAQHSFGTTASGSFTCDTPRPGLTVEVCLEVLAENLWERAACSTESAADATSVSAEAYGCKYGLWLVRSVAAGSASTGETAWAASVPQPYFCTPL